MPNELDQEIDNLNNAIKALLEYVYKNGNHPFFKTDDGQYVLRRIEGIAMDTTLLNTIIGVMLGIENIRDKG